MRLLRLILIGFGITLFAQQPGSKLVQPLFQPTEEKLKYGTDSKSPVQESTPKVTNEQLPELSEVDLRAYWISETKAQRAEVEMYRARATRDAKFDVLRKQCLPYKLVIVNEEKLLCSR